MIEKVKQLGIRIECAAIAAIVGWSYLTPIYGGIKWLMNHFNAG